MFTDVDKNQVLPSLIKQCWLPAYSAVTKTLMGVTELLMQKLMEFWGNKMYLPDAGTDQSVFTYNHAHLGFDIPGR